MAGTAFVIILFTLDLHNPRTEFRAGVKAIDWFGIFAMLGLTIMFLLGINFGGETFPWSSPKVICLIVFGLSMSVLFYFSEARLAKYPLVPLSIVRERSNVASLVVGFAHGMVRLRPAPGLPGFRDSQHPGLHRGRILPPALLPIRPTSIPSPLRRPPPTLHPGRMRSRQLNRCLHQQDRPLPGSHLARHHRPHPRHWTLHPS